MPASPQKHLRAGEALAASGLFTEALAEFVQALRVLPTSAQAANNAGAALRIIGRSDEAIAYLERAIALQSDFADAEYNLGTALATIGQLEAACSHYERAIALRPSDAPAHADLGNVFVRRELYEEAIASYDRAVAIDPQHAPAHNGLGIAAQKLGRHNEAQAAYERAIALAPHDAQIRFNLATLQHERGALLESTESYRVAIALDPNFAAAHNNLGVALQLQGALQESFQAYARAFEIDPTFAQSACNAGIVLCELERYDEAQVFLLRSIEIDPRNANAHNAFGTVFQAQGRLPEALAEFDAAIAANPNHAEAHNNVGVVARAMGDYDRAFAAYGSALALSPGYAAAHANLGVAYMETGEFAEAEQSFDRALDLNQGNAHFFNGWSLIRTVRPDDRHIVGMQRLYERIDSLPANEQVELHFTLGKVYDDLGRYEEAFDHLEAGNRLKRSLVPYDEDATFAYFERIAAAFTDELMRAHNGSGNPSDRPLFIVGMPRSGTTLVEQILASHPKVHAAGERADVHFALTALVDQRRTRYPEVVAALGPFDLSMLGATYVERIGPLAHGAESVTDKMTSNFFHVGAIALMLPRARIIHIRRDPVDTCLSCYAHLFSEPQPHTYDLTELGHYYRAYERLMQHWRDVLPNDMMLEVRYEDIVADVEAQARRILSHARLEWDARCLNFHQARRIVRTASVSQVRQPLYSTAIGRSRNYRDHLGPLIEALRQP